MQTRYQLPSHYSLGVMLEQDTTGCRVLSYFNCSKQCYIEGKIEEVTKNWDIGLSYAKKFDDFLASEREIPYAPRSRQNLAAMWNDFGQYNTMVKRQLAWYENNPWYEELRKTDGFNEMLEKYRLFSNDIN